MKHHIGSLSIPVVLVLFAVMSMLAVVISTLSIKTVIKTSSDVSHISQGDTILFSMLESEECSESNLSVKYIIGVGLANSGKNPVEVDYNGVNENVDVKECVKKFMKSINEEEYEFEVTYNGRKYYVVSERYDESRPKKTDEIYISVPDSASGIAKVVLNLLFPPSGDEICPEKDGTYFCVPKPYCILRGASCNPEYTCGAAACCCPK